MSSESDVSAESEFNDSDFELPKTKKKSPAKRPPAASKATAASKPKQTKAPAAKKTMSKAVNGVANSGDGDGGDPENVFETLDHATSGGKKRLSIESIYQRLSQLEHVLVRPDTYIGSVDKHTEPLWVWDGEQNKMVFREVTYVPGLYKIFDEILVNAADNKQRDSKMNTIKITIDPDKNEISVWNNGKGIPVVEHNVEKMYVPEMIFGTLLTSSNFDDNQKKVTGGRNGFGAKLCNIFSTKFTVETSSTEYKKSFKQTWTNNMNKDVEPEHMNAKGLRPVVKTAEKEDFTKITFQPDLKRFKLKELDEDHVGLLSKRAFDIAGIARGVRVFLNGTRLPITSFKDYTELYLKDQLDEEGNKVKYEFETVNPRWEVAITHSDKGFQQVSFVNSINTTKGGKHVDYVTDMIVNKMIEHIRKQLKKSGGNIRPFQVKNHMWIFVNCLIENPAFGSQTKEQLTSQASTFGSKCEFDDKFISRAIKNCKIVDNIMQWVRFKQQNQLNQKCHSNKHSKLRGMPKLEDANEAGSKTSDRCTLILTEGDSAKTLAVAGLAVIGRDRYGVFPLRGKVLNVREANHKQVMENVETNNVIKILGLQYKKKYDTEADRKSLRYGKLMIMTDQDQDGSHIKGLIINFIHHNWPSLIRANFVEEFITPIVKVTKGREEISMFSLPEYEEWKADTPNWKSWKIKYYKGLGTSTSKEAKEYFSDMVRHRVPFRYSGNEDDTSIELAFSKSRVDDRKEWLTNFMEDRKRRRELGLPDIYLYEKDTRHISYKDFVNKELILFSNMDNERSIPSLVDGFKPGQRKVLFTCFKRNLKKEVKVAQLVGSVAEMSAYHHGETSLMGTIVNLAQNYVGSNNINLLMPIGQFGTRLQGGKDSASPRYIFTHLNPLTRYIFPEHDDYVLRYLYDDNLRIEPEWYCPIIPMVLVNGAEGIGTAWSTKVLNFNPEDLVRNIRKMLNGEELDDNFLPWYRHFRGETHQLTPTRFAFSGEVSILEGTTIEITELPVGTWTQNYKENILEPFLYGSEKTPVLLSDFKEYHTEATVRFVVKVLPEKWNSVLQEGLHNKFKLQTAATCNSMVLFDHKGVLRRFDNICDIFQDFYTCRLNLYTKRRDYLLGMLTAQSERLSEQARFILLKIEGKIKLENKKKKDIVEQLIQHRFKRDPVQSWREEVQRKQKLEELPDEAANADDEDEEENATSAESAEKRVISGYEYLVNQYLIKLSWEEKMKLEKERDEKLAEVKVLKGKTDKDLWLADLDKFEEEYKKVLEQERKDIAEGKMIAAKGPKAKGGRGGGGGSTKSSKETQPSEFGERITPGIQELKVKYEKLDKPTKGTRGKKKEAEPNGVETMDLASRLLKQRRLSGKVDDAKSIKRFLSTAAAKKEPTDGDDSDIEEVKVDGAGDKPKPTKKKTAAAAPRNKKERSPKKPTYKDNSDSEDEEEDEESEAQMTSSDSEAEAPKKKPSGKKQVVDSDSEGESSKDGSDDDEIAPRALPKRARKPAKFDFDDDDDDDLVASSNRSSSVEPEPEVHNMTADQLFDQVKASKKLATNGVARSKPYIIDDDSSRGSSSMAGKAASSKGGSGKRKMNFADSDDSDFKGSDDDAKKKKKAKPQPKKPVPKADAEHLPTSMFSSQPEDDDSSRASSSAAVPKKAAPKSKPAAASKPKKAAAPAPKKPAPKKKPSVYSDVDDSDVSDMDFREKNADKDDGDSENESPQIAATTGRARKKVNYALESDDDDAY